jgi:drug/metabolite transporter (DMT)-like permease
MATAHAPHPHRWPCQVTLALLWLSGLETPSRRVLLCVLGICGGTAMASLGEGSLHPLGLGLMLLAEAAEATRLVLTQRLLKNLKFGVRHTPRHPS